jgi:hypothetical protein
MNAARSIWLDLVWKALGEADRSKKDALLRKAYDFVPEPHGPLKPRRR